MGIIEVGIIGKEMLVYFNACGPGSERGTLSEKDSRRNWIEGLGGVRF